MKETISIAGVKFTAHSCHESRAAAKARAVSTRQKQGIKVRVLKNGKKFCLYTGSKIKRARAKKR